MKKRQRIASSARMTRALLNEGKLIPVPPIEKAHRFPGRTRPQSRYDRPPAPRDHRLPGDGKERNRGRWRILYGADEVMIVTITYDHAARRRSYELIAEAFGLS